MSDQASLFDNANRTTRDLPALERESLKRTQEAIRRVDENASEYWKRLCDEAIRHVAYRQEYLTADDVWWALEDIEAPAPHEPRALGARLQAAKRAGLIVNAGTPVMSKRPETHGSWIAQWQSLARRPA